ncbi:MAG TPA: OmpH family outer membrane protein [Acidobacteriaceae bacterium]|nr:OmpH family outer membrane protein [Acidobacteriaceae bacterium]
MKRSFTFVCLLASATGVGILSSPSSALAQAPSAPAPAPAQSAGLAAAPAPEFPANPKIAIIAFQQAVAATNEGQRSFAQLRTKFEPKQAALKAQSDEIDSLKKQLQDAGANLSEPERDSRLRTIDEKTKSLQRSAEDAQNEASGAMNDMYQQLAQKVYAVLDAYSNQNKFTIVLDTSAQQTPVLWANQGSDITKEVVAAYNAKSGVPPQPAAAAPRPSAPTPSHTGITPRPSTTTPRPSTTKPPQ